jgi:hypothetical protein
VRSRSALRARAIKAVGIFLYYHHTMTALILWSVSLKFAKSRAVLQDVTRLPWLLPTPAQVLQCARVALLSYVQDLLHEALLAVGHALSLDADSKSDRKLQAVYICICYHHVIFVAMFVIFVAMVVLQSAHVALLSYRSIARY